MAANNPSFFDQLVQDLLRAKPNNYSEQCISYYLDQHQFTIEDLSKVYNHRHEKLKCTLIRRFKTRNKHKQNLLSQKCILYLHGLGSNRLEALTIAQYMPKNYCLCMFDMSGSGKSEGSYVTYGLKEQEDIEPVIKCLQKKYQLKSFVLWGRSMGAVATLLYAQDKYSAKGHKKGTLSVGESLRNSRVQGNIVPLGEDSLVKGIILDSPFHNFKDIAKEIATKKMGLPNFILDLALNYVEDSFGRLLGTSLGPKYNPFNINFNSQIKLSIPILILHSEKDEIVPASHCQKIMKHIISTFERIPINNCSHNQVRPAEAIFEVFLRLDKFNRLQNHEEKKMNASMSRDMTISYTADRKRGIFVYTPSKEKDRKTIDQSRFVSTILNEVIQVQNVNTDQPGLKSPRARTSVVRGSSAGLKMSRKSSQLFESKNRRVQVFNSDNLLSNLNTIDNETTKLLNQKLTQIKTKETGISRLGRFKQVNNDKRKQIKLTHQKYLE